MVSEKLERCIEHSWHRLMCWLHGHVHTTTRTETINENTYHTTTSGPMCYVWWSPLKCLRCGRAPALKGPK